MTEQQIDAQEEVLDSSTETQADNLVEDTLEDEGLQVEQPASDSTYLASDEISDKVQKRINKLTFEKHETERQLNARIKELEEAAKANQVNQSVDKPPRLQDFDFDEEKYQLAAVEYAVNKKLAAQEQANTKQQTDVKLQEDAAGFATQQQAYAANKPDYVELVSTMGQAVTSNAVTQFILSSDNGAKLHHELLKNFAKLAEIQNLPEWKQGAELARFESTLTKQKQTHKSKAPAPAAPLRGVASKSSKQASQRVTMF